MRLTAAEIERYRTHGYLVRDRLFREEELALLRDTVEEVIGAVAERATRPDAGPELRMADGHRLQFSSQTVIQWEWREGSQQVRLIEPFTHLHPRFAALWK